MLFFFRRRSRFTHKQAETRRDGHGGVGARRDGHGGVGARKKLILLYGDLL